MRSKITAWRQEFLLEKLHLVMRGSATLDGNISLEYLHFGSAEFLIEFKIII
jgi:hypothetical protein